MTAPQQLSQYRLEALLTSDRYGEIYRAVDSVRRRTVALRLLRVEEIGDVAAVSRFMQQALRAADLVHPRLAWVWEVGEAEGRYYLVERFVNGPTLAQRLAERGPLSWEEAQAAMAQLAQGLDFAHGRGFDLGAVRPQNIWLSPGLGLALGLPPNRPIEQREEALYTAPELWQGRPHTPASDQYALACVLGEMLTGQPLFDAPTIDEIQARHLGELELPHSLPPDAPWQVELALERALSQRPGERYANSAELAEAPAKLALRGAGDETERERRAALAQTRKLADEQAHRLAEEAARLAALEQARRELEEQLRRPPPPPETPALQVQPTSEPLPPPEELAAPPRAALTDQWRHTGDRRRSWIAWAGLAAVLLILAGLWLSGRLPGVNPLAASLTPSPTPAASETLRPTGNPSPTASLTHTATLTPSTTSTHTPIATPTRTPTLTATATETLTPTLIPTTRRPTRDAANDD
jgi:serine/threonine protein kinase